MAGRLNCGLIGCGEIAVQTSKSILGLDTVRVVHCMDTVEELVGDLAEKHGARSSTRVDDLLADKELQAVIISTPHYLHAPLAVQAAEAGKHVLVEKPIACTLAQADEMIEAAEKAGVKLGVLYPRRLGFGPEKAKELVRGGALGRVVAAKIHAMSNKPEHYWHGGYSGRAKSDWRVSLEKSGGGYLVMNLIHNLDILVSILDPSPKRIYAEYGTFLTSVEVEDYISCVMRLQDGTIVSLDGSSVAAGGESFGDRIYGEKGQIALTRGEFRVFLEEPWGEVKAGEWVTISKPDKPSDARALHVDLFSRAVLSGGEVPVSGREGRRSLEIARGAYLSMERGGPVEFPVKE